MDRVKDPDETVELTIEGRGLLVGMTVLLVVAYLDVASSGPLRWISIVVTVAIVVSTLRGARWSPLFVGPLLTLSSTRIAGRGGLLQPAWTLRWDQVDRFGWGRYGLFVHRRGAAEWQGPLMQGGLGGPRLVAALSTRLAAYRQAHDGSNGGGTEAPRASPEV